MKTSFQYRANKTILMTKLSH